MSARLFRPLTLTLALLACSPAGAATVLIDVRTPAEYSEGHLEGALNIPYDEIDKRIAEAARRDDEVIVYCRSGRRSHEAGQTLIRLGYRNVLDYGAMDDARKRVRATPEPSQRP
ncbi:rhodanese-like domain-containing protein [Uliginosibacterium paludis]|uniref:Rhodanese-like domain-containing protein n=1 Tax=Uliginosibacterium paludis TaxID=1615952 RepID=A0ABV2CS36_9RHOO